MTSAAEFDKRDHDLREATLGRPIGEDSVPVRALGTMVTYGYPGCTLEAELALAMRFRVEVLEILPEWSLYPDPGQLHLCAADHGLAIHSAHGSWGSRSIRADRVDLGSTNPAIHRESVDDLKRCADWLNEAGGTCLVVHPGGLSDPDQVEPRRAALARGLLELADHASVLGVRICVENMPPGVHPGSRMSDLARLLAELKHPSLALALDTGHAHISATVPGETHAAESLLATTHVHDNNARQDSHLPPGLGTIDWTAWGRALDEIHYTGPIMMECIRHLRQAPSDFRADILRGICVVNYDPS